MTAAGKAIEELRLVIRRRHLSYSTEKSYCAWLRRYCEHIEQNPEGTSAGKVTSFLSGLAVNGCSASSQNQAFQALLLFYREVRQVDLGNIDALRAKRPQHQRYAPSVDEVSAILRQSKDVAGYPTRLVLHMLYGCGLRLREPLNIRMMDVDLAGSQIAIRRAKGQKDRTIAIPCNLSEPIRKQMSFATAMWERDRSSDLPCKLPASVANKSSGYASTRGWYWLFPQHKPCRDPRSGQLCRYHMHEVNVQRCCRDAAKSVGLFGVVTPHSLRHAYATHAMRGGANVRDVQVVMGHKCIETTMGYLHPECGSVPSPLAGMEVKL
jgi:site-specific recombinase XerD